MGPDALLHPQGFVLKLGLSPYGSQIRSDPRGLATILRSVSNSASSPAVRR